MQSKYKWHTNTCISFRWTFTCLCMYLWRLPPGGRIRFFFFRTYLKVIHKHMNNGKGAVGFSLSRDVFLWLMKYFVAFIYTRKSMFYSQNSQYTFHHLWCRFAYGYFTEMKEGHGSLQCLDLIVDTRLYSIHVAKRMGYLLRDDG